MPSQSQYDVAIVGAGIAGCAAAIFLGRAGARVALIERDRDPAGYKKLCTHFIQASATPTLERLGLVSAIEEAGGVRNDVEIFTRWGWIVAPSEQTIRRPAFGFNIRRSTLDPMLRKTAAQTVGVECLPGFSARELLVGQGRICGVSAQGEGDAKLDIEAKLVVGADGRNSRVAELAGLPAKETPNGRIGYFAHYRNLSLASGTRSQMWFMEPDVAYTFPNDDGVTLVTAMPARAMATVRDALDAADRGEKTLIFCSRVATLAQMRKDLDAIWEERVLERWRRVYPGASPAEIFDRREADERRHVGRHSLLQARFRRSQDALYLALRESYLWDAPFGHSASDDLSRVVQEANEILQAQTTGKTTAERIDYQLAKYCVERAVFQLRHPAGGPEIERRDAIEVLLKSAQSRRGSDPDEEAVVQDGTGERPRWAISKHMAETVLGRVGSLWSSQSDLLGRLQPPLRVTVVEQLARYLTYKQVPFFAELLEAAAGAGIATDSVESAALLDYLPEFWKTQAGLQWTSVIRTFLVYFVERDPHQQADILDGPIRTADFARHTRDGESRERLREAFNTPLYPMVLIANEVMQEGLDLHKHCRRIVHHDLAWNPAQVEQRIGRIDRLGSLTSRLRTDSPDVMLEVIYPVIRGTIDERMYRTVKAREKWLEFLLGAQPNFREFAFGDEEPPPLPDRLGRELSINLAPLPKPVAKAETPSVPVSGQ